MRRPPAFSAIVFAYGPVRPCVVCIVRYTQCLMWPSHENDDCDDDYHDHECMHMSEHNTHAYNMCCAHSCTRMCTLFHMPTFTNTYPRCCCDTGIGDKEELEPRDLGEPMPPPFRCPHTKKEASLAATAVVVTCVVNQLGQQHHAQTQNTERNRPLPRTQTQRHLTALATTDQDLP
jgi:hypothetical protein